MGDGESYDLLVIGGGINGVGVARDAAGRGLRVVLAEAGDLAGATSSASSKLIHGGLRYLEQYQFRLVRESLAEREILLQTAGHLVHPRSFILPHNDRLRPAWLLRLGLVLYDHLGQAPWKRRDLAKSRGVKFASDPRGAPLKPALAHGFSYSDCWVDDARLVIVTAIDAAERGADIHTRTRVRRARPTAEGWTIDLEPEGGAPTTVNARAIVNAAGPWAADVDRAVLGLTDGARLRLVKGSHIVVPKLYDGDHAYILQAADRRVVFVLPFAERFSLIGTTDVEITDLDQPPTCSAAEVDYLCRTVADYFRVGPTAADVVASFAGVRPLYDDARAKAAEVTRDYVLALHRRDGAPVLSVYGGKLTTYRHLAEAALEKLGPIFPDLPGPWTATAALPGSEQPLTAADLTRRYSWLDPALARRYVAAYGLRALTLLGDAASRADLGAEVVPGLHTREIAYLRQVEWAESAADILWRRSKLGLTLPADAATTLDTWLKENSTP